MPGISRRNIRWRMGTAFTAEECLMSRTEVAAWRRTVLRKDSEKPARSFHSLIPRAMIVRELECPVLGTASHLLFLSANEHAWPQLRAAEELAEQHVEMVHAIFPLYRVAPAIVGRGTKTTLHIFAQPNIFLLHLITESNGTLDALLYFAIAHVVKKPFKNGQRLVVRNGHNQVG